MKITFVTFLIVALASYTHCHATMLNLQTKKSDTTKFENSLKEYLDLFTEYSLPNSHARSKGFNLSAHLDSIKNRMETIGIIFYSSTGIKYINE